MQSRLNAAALIVCALSFSITVAHAKPLRHTQKEFTQSSCDNNGRCSGMAALSPEPVDRRQSRRHKSRHHDAPVRAYLATVNTAAGIPITCHPSACSKFQALIAALVAQGNKPRFITCYARGHKSGSNHAWGGACDIDQTGWGRTSGFMYRAGAAIRAAGLYDGCSFRDCGHVEAMRGLHNHPPNIYAAVAKFKEEQESR